jgi:hypothetical protein
MAEIFCLTGVRVLERIDFQITANIVLEVYMDEIYVTIRIFEERSWNILEERSANKKMQAI